MYESLKADDAFRCKDRTYPRLAYVEEYDVIMACQKVFYPDVLTSERIAYIRDYIIFHQRPLKSCKHLVGHCQLESVDSDGNPRKYAPKVASRTSPLFQTCKIWESINNLKINNKFNDTLHITLDQKQKIYDYLRVNEKLLAKELAKILGVKPTEWFCGKAIGRGLQGDTTYVAIKKALGNHPESAKLLRFDIRYSDGNRVNTDTGEMTKVVDASFEQEPLYQLWHVLYSISDIEELSRLLKCKFGINDENVIQALCQIDFVKAGYGNKSSRAMRKILPYLQDGMQYYDAKVAAG
jgi:CRISPR-associated endonuclease Csn1